MTPLSTLKLTRHYKRHSHLFRQSEPCKGIFVVLRGNVALFTANSSGQPIQLGCAREGSVIGLCETIGGGAYQTTALADTDVTAHFIPTEDVLSLMSDDPATGMQVLQMLVGDATRLYGWIKRMPFQGRGVQSERIVSTNLGGDSRHF